MTFALSYIVVANGQKLSKSDIRSDITLDFPTTSTGYLMVDSFVHGLDLVSSTLGLKHTPYPPRVVQKDQQKIHQYEKKTHDYVFNISLIDDLWSTSGLPIVFQNQSILDFYDSSVNTCLEVTIFSLKFNSGKTWFLEDLLGYGFDTGHGKETKGASGYYDNGICFKEIMGFGRADKLSNDRHKSMARDHILTQIALKMTQVMIIVVNELTIGDIMYLKDFQSELLLNNPDAHVIYIHNPYSYGEQDAMDILIKNDILNGFDAVSHLSGNNTWWSGRIRNEKHFLFGNSSNNLGRKYNEYTLSTIRQQLDQLRGEAKRIDLLNRTAQVTSEALPKIVPHPNLTSQQKFFMPTFNPQDLQVAQTPRMAMLNDEQDHTTGWWNGLSTSVTNTVSSMKNGIKRATSFFSVMEEEGDSDACKLYKDLSLDAYDVTYAPKLLEDGRIEMQMRLVNNKTLTYFSSADMKSSSTSATGLDLMFDIKHDLFIDDKSNLIMRFEVLDSHTKLKFENRKVILAGCRIPPNVNVKTMLSTSRKPRYSTFYLVVEIPDDPSFPYDLYQSNLDNKLDKSIATQGILTLTFPPKKRRNDSPK